MNEEQQVPALRQAVENMANMREAYDNLSQAAEAYNTGKVQLAENITSKGVEASATETLPELAQKVAAISQETYEINGGEMYAKQLFGSLETPNYWNLYEVLANLLSDGRLVSYGGILLAEYYRGYDSLALSGAGASGAYVVSDLDENGQFKMYTADTTHTWATEFDGKGNRWVAYCFADEYHDFQITDTNTSPRSIFIGRKVGTISLLTNSRTSEIVVPEGNELYDFGRNNSAIWCKNSRNVVLRLKNIVMGITIVNGLQANSIESVYLEFDKSNAGAIVYEDRPTDPIKSIIIKGNECIVSGNNGFGFGSPNNQISSDACYCFDIAKIEVNGSNTRFITGLVGMLSLTTEEINIIYGYLLSNCNLKHLSINYKTNDKTKAVTITQSGGSVANLTDIELKDGWCKPLYIAFANSITKENVQAHIFDRLGVNDLSTGAVTITLSTAVLNLFTQEEIDAVVARTNITIVGA